MTRMDNVQKIHLENPGDIRFWWNVSAGCRRWIVIVEILSLRICCLFTSWKCLQNTEVSQKYFAILLEFMNVFIYSSRFTDSYRQLKFSTMRHSPYSTTLTLTSKSTYLEGNFISSQHISPSADKKRKHTSFQVKDVNITSLQKSHFFRTNRNVSRNTKPHSQESIRSHKLTPHRPKEFVAVFLQDKAFQSLPTLRHPEVDQP